MVFTVALLIFKFHKSRIFSAVNVLDRVKGERQLLGNNWLRGGGCRRVTTVVFILNRFLLANFNNFARRVLGDRMTKGTFFLFFN